MHAEILKSLSETLRSVRLNLGRTEHQLHQTPSTTGKLHAAELTGRIRGLQHAIEVVENDQLEESSFLTGSGAV